MRIERPELGGLQWQTNRWMYKQMFPRVLQDFGYFGGRTNETSSLAYFMTLILSRPEKQSKNLKIWNYMFLEYLRPNTTHVPTLFASQHFSCSNTIRVPIVLSNLLLYPSESSLSVFPVFHIINALSSQNCPRHELLSILPLQRRSFLSALRAEPFQSLLFSPFLVTIIFLL